MSKINKEKLNMLEERLDKFDSELEKFISEVIDPKKEQFENVKNELEENRKQLEDMDINGINDTVTFLKVKSRITELEGLLEKSEDEYNDVLGLQKEFEELQNNKLYENFLNSSSENCIKHEFSDNMLLLQKQMYKKFLEIEKICNQMKDLEKDYMSIVRSIDHPKVYYVSTDSYPYMNKVHCRFGLNRIVSYYTGVTLDKYDFEY